ncbi:MAG: hypothetical protein V1820_05895 [archaeon]
MTCKFVLPDKREFSFPDEATALKEAQTASKQLNHILIVREDKGGNWPEIATVFPSGEIRKPVDVSSFARGLETKRKISGIRR